MPNSKKIKKAFKIAKRRLELLSQEEFDELLKKHSNGDIAKSLRELKYFENDDSMLKTDKKHQRQLKKILGDEINKEIDSEIIESLKTGIPSKDLIPMLNIKKKVIKKTWESEVEYFVSFLCPKCKKQIDQGHLEDMGIVAGDDVNTTIECPYYKCSYRFNINIRKRRN